MDESPTAKRGIRIPREVVLNAARLVEGSDLTAMEGICDEIFKAQPLALAHVVALSGRGMPDELLDHAFHLLMVYYEACKAAKLPIIEITEEILEEAWQDVNAKCQYLEGETTEDDWRKAVALDAGSYRETHLLAYTVDYLRDHVLKSREYGEKEELLSRTVLVMFHAFMVVIGPIQ